MEKRKLINKFLSGILAPCLLMGLLPLSAFAQSTGVTVGDFIVTGGTQGTDYEYDDISNVLTITGNAPLEISMVQSVPSPSTDTIVVQSGVIANLTLNNVRIDVNSSANICAFDVQSNSVANITLTGNNNLTSGDGKAGLQVQSSTTLVLNVDGTLIANGNGGGAGIGGGTGGDGGEITIMSGTVAANGNGGGAGIGGGTGGDGGEITIMSGTVTATGNGGGAGIGDGSSGTGGIININGGTVTATGGSGTQAFSAKPKLSAMENQMAEVVIIAGASSSGSVVSPSNDYHINKYAKITIENFIPTIHLGTALTYNATQQMQIVNSVEQNTSTLLDNVDYIISGNTATNAGEHTLTITGKGDNFIGAVTKVYTIERATLTIAGATAQNMVFDGTTNATADVSFSGLLNGQTLIKDTDYTVSATFPNHNVGDNLTVTGVVLLTHTAAANNYIFSNAEFSFPTAASITPLSLAGAQVTLGTPLVANGTEQTQSIASMTLGNLILTKGTDFIVSGNTATGAGSYTLTITGIGNYVGTLTMPFTVAESTTTALSPQTGIDTPETGTQGSAPPIVVISLILALGTATTLLYRKKRISARKK